MSASSLCKIMMAEGGEDDFTVFEQKRVCKPTERALEEQLHRHISLRRAKLSALTSKIKTIEGLMIDDGNLQNVGDLMQLEFAQLITEFTDLNVQVKDLLPENEKTADQTNWFEPKMDSLRLFIRKSKDWMAAVGDKSQNYNVEMEDVVTSQDSASQISVHRSESKQKRDSDIDSGSISSSVLSACAREESKRATLLARAASLKKNVSGYVCNRGSPSGRYGERRQRDSCLKHTYKNTTRWPATAYDVTTSATTV